MWEKFDKNKIQERGVGVGGVEVTITKQYGQQT